VYIHSAVFNKKQKLGGWPLALSRHARASNEVLRSAALRLQRRRRTHKDTLTHTPTSQAICASPFVPLNIEVVKGAKFLHEVY
jgi:hypothetical protein